MSRDKEYKRKEREREIERQISLQTRDGIGNSINLLELKRIRQVMNFPSGLQIVMK